MVNRGRGLKPFVEARVGDECVMDHGLSDRRYIIKSVSPDGSTAVISYKTNTTHGSFTWTIGVNRLLMTRATERLSDRQNRGK